MVDNPVLTSAEADYFRTRGETPIEENPAPAAEPVADNEPAAAPEPAPEPVDDTAEPQAPDDRKVPLAALHEARSQIKAEKEARAALEKRVADDRAEWERRFAAMQQAFQQPVLPETPAAAPDPQADPLGYVQHIGQTAQTTEQRVEQFMRQQQAQQQEAQIRGWAAQQERTFAATAPDYLDAIGFLQKSRADELMAMGVPSDRIEATIRNEADSLLVHAVQNGLNPAEVAYNVAVKRGFSKPAAAPAPDPAEQAVEKVQTIQRGQQLATRVPSSGASQGQMTTQALIDMPAHEFDAWIARHPAQARRLLGE